MRYTFNYTLKELIRLGITIRNLRKDEGEKDQHFLLLNGRSLKEIASELRVKECKVKQHLYLELLRLRDKNNTLVAMT